jgi:DNA mismatch endonuclease (patch repair protein)
MRRTAQRNTAIEVEVRRELYRRGYRYRLHPRLKDITRARPDFIFPRARVAVFVDGCFWHRCPRHGTLPKANHRWWAAKLRANMRRDRQHNRELVAAGWRVVRVWEHETIQAAAQRVEEAIIVYRPQPLRAEYYSTVLT